MAKGNKNAAAVAAPANDVAKFSTDATLRGKGLESLSARIRALQAEGATTAQIAKIVLRSNGEHPRYQHVRNVLRQPLKKVASPAATEEANS